MKKAEPKICAWCGTKLRPPKPGCPRGPFCEKERTDYEAIDARAK